MFLLNWNVLPTVTLEANSWASLWGHCILQYNSTNSTRLILFVANLCTTMQFSSQNLPPFGVKGILLPLVHVDSFYSTKSWILYIKGCMYTVNLYNQFNPLLPIAHKSAQIDKISILKLEGIIKKISYERRDYESVDEKSLSKAMSRKTTKKRIQALTG